MNKLYQNLIRITLIVIGIIFFIFAYISFNNNISQIQNNQISNSQNLLLLNLDKINYDMIIFFVAIGYIFFIIGIYWSNTFKSLSKTIISISIIFITLSLFLYPIHSNSQTISNSVQPTLDYIIVNSFDNMFNTINSKYDKQLNTKLDIILSENTTTKKIYSKNISQKDIDFIINELNLTTMPKEQKELFVKFLINSIYTQLKQNNPQIENIPISISQLKDIISSQIDISLIQNMNTELLESYYIPNEEAYIFIITSQNKQKITIDYNNLKTNEINFIWKNLNFTQNISQEQKEKILTLFLSEIKSQLNKQDLATNVTVPIDTVKYLIPDDIKYILSTQILSNNTSAQIKYLKQIRLYCENQVNTTQTCKKLLLTKYENFIKEINTPDKQSMSPQIVTIDTTQYDTINKINSKIENLTNYSIIYFIIGILLLILSYLTYYLHFKLFNRNFYYIDIGYNISKLNFFNLLINFILLYLLYIFLQSDLFFNSIKNNFLINNTIFNIELIKNMPIYNTLIEMYKQSLILGIIYLSISLIIVILLYYSKNKIINAFKKSDKISQEEQNIKNYIEKYKDQYSEKSIKKALENTNNSQEQINEYIKKYYY